MLVASASPASAHGEASVEPTNYRTDISGLHPADPRIKVTTADIGTRLVLENTSNVEVVVMGYDGEPYLRIDERGVFENVRSPARFLNRSLKPSSDVPSDADPTASPRWRKVSSGSTARWHDHRAYWMSPRAPAAVTRDPQRKHVVIDNWEVPIRVGGRRAVIEGDVRWVPGPLPIYWLMAAVASFAVVFLVHRVMAWRVVALGTVGVLDLAVIYAIVNVFCASTASNSSKFSATLLASIGAIIGLATLGWLSTPMWRRAVPAVLFTSVTSFLLVGFADLTVLWKSQVLTTGPSDLARIAVTLTLGAGSALAVISIRELQPSGTSPDFEVER